MSAAWTIVVAVGAGTMVLKGLGPVALGGRQLPARVQGVLALLAPTLLAALIVVQAFGAGRQLVIDAPAAGLAAAVVSVALRAPVLVTVLAAAAVAAGVRALTA